MHIHPVYISDTTKKYLEGLYFNSNIIMYITYADFMVVDYYYYNDLLTRYLGFE